MKSPTVRLLTALAGAVLLLGPATAAAADDPDPDPGSGTAAEHRATTPVQHFVYLMQGPRTFDNYFGTYPGADGIPAGACQPRTADGPAADCVRPYALHDKAPGPLSPSRSIIAAQVNGGRMDGFVSAYTRQGRDGTPVMGHYDARDLPFSWAAADRYVLFDRFFSAVPYGTAAERSYWVSGAAPTAAGDRPTIFDRLQQAGVSWKFYVQDYRPGENVRAPGATQQVRVPLLGYARFLDDPALASHIVDLDQYYRDLDNGTLPSVAYISSSGSSETSARSVPAGQKLIRSLATQLALSPYWDSSALLWSYDGSGGWYDHVAPPPAADGPRGLRVPAVLISAYAPAGRVDHQVLDSSSALRFIEDNWNLEPLGGRVASATGLAAAFDFSAAPRPPEVLAVPTARPAVRPVNAALVYGLYGGALGAGALLVVATALVTARRRSAVPPAPAGPPGPGGPSGPGPAGPSEAAGPSGPAEPPGSARPSGPAEPSGPAGPPASARPSRAPEGSPP
ncbi:alkaline phosphatase family protein [Streptomyces globisporus]|uniref:alkaline phosphatase family protein n=1 Tax=Streptomyces globisporus TaxID=1908 RepID=UPI0004CABC55|nr:alkaline phosphatase family protein [Streptomyces globisporus]